MWQKSQLKMLAFLFGKLSGVLYSADILRHRPVICYNNVNNEQENSNYHSVSGDVHRRAE